MSGCDDILRRRFIAIAIDQFEAYPALKGVPGEVAALRSWWCDPARETQAFSDAGFEALAQRPSLGAVETALKETDFTAADAVVLYVTSHGAWDKGQHWIVLEKSNPARLAKTALSSLDLLLWLVENPGLEQVLLILDLCDAGALQDQITRPLRKALPDNWIVLLTAPPEAPATVGTFTRAVQATLEELRTSSERDASALEPHLEPEVFIKKVTRLMSAEHQKLIVLHGGYESSCCLPNPKYDPRRGDRVATAPARSDLAVLAADMTGHWSPRSRGVSGEGPSEWLFTGRTRLMERLVELATGPRGTALVAGRVGSGKSAVLARLVTCSDPIFRATHGELIARVQPVPPADSVDVAILATGKSTLQVASQLAASLGAADASSGSDLETSVTTIQGVLRARDEPLTIVVDALDEASDPTGLVLTLLSRINPAAEPNVRLLVGVRSSANAEHDGEREDQNEGEPDELVTIAKQALGATVLEVDDDHWWEDANLVGYATSILARASSPYSADPERAADVAQAIEKQCGRSFLFASLVASQLSLDPVALAPDDPRLSELLAGGVRAAFRADLQRSFPLASDRECALALLRATALAFGRGLPWRDLWAAVASAISGRELADDDIEWLLEHSLGGYLVRSVEDNVTVYRPFHDQLRATLAREPERFRDDAAQLAGATALSASDAHRAIALRLHTRIRDHRERRAAPPPAYTRRHLVEHAAQGGVLHDTVLDVDTLPWLDAETLSEVTRLSQAPLHSHAWFLLSAWRGIRHRWSFDEPEANAAALAVALSALRHGCSEVYPQRGWVFEPLWAHWTWGGTVIAHAPRVRPIASGMVAGRPAIAVGADGGIQICDTATGRAIGDPLRFPSGFSPMALTMRNFRGATLVAAGGYGAVHVWNATSGQRSGFQSSTGQVVELALFERNGHICVLTVGHGPTAALWDLEDTRAPNLEIPVGAVKCACVADDPPVLAVVSLDQTSMTKSRWDGDADALVQQWDLRDGATVGVPIAVRSDVEAVALAHRRGVRLLGFGTHRGEVCVVDADSGAQQFSLTEDSPVNALSWWSGGEDLLLAAGWRDGTAQVLDLRSGNDEHMPHPDSVNGVTFAFVDDRPMLVTSCGDGAVRLWDAVSPSGERVYIGDRFQTVTLARHQGEIYTGALDLRPRAQCWSAAGVPSGALIAPEGSRHVSFTLGIAGGRLSALLVCGGFDGYTVHWRDVDEHSEVTSTRSFPLIQWFGMDSRTYVAALFLHGQPAIATLEHIVIGGTPEAHLRVFAALDGRLLMARELRAGAQHLIALWCHVQERERELPNSNTLLAIAYDDRVEVLDAERGAALYSVPPVPALTQGTALSSLVAAGRHGGRPVLATKGGQDLRLWDLFTGEPVGSVPVGERRHFAFARVQGQDLILAMDSDTVYALHARTGRTLAKLPFGTRIHALAVAPHDEDADSIEIAVAGPGIMMARMYFAPEV